LNVPGRPDLGFMAFALAAFGLEPSGSEDCAPRAGPRRSKSPGAFGLAPHGFAPHGFPPPDFAPQGFAPGSLLPEDLDAEGLEPHGFL
jgi:hypothetical protein